MPKPLQWILSLIFIGQMYVAMAVVAVLWAVPALFSRDLAVSGVHAYARWVMLTARILVGLRVETRGEIPDGPVLIAAKHQSFFDIIYFCATLPRPRFVMKRELIYTPFLGQYALRVGCIPVDRGKGGKAVGKMKADVAAGADFPGQLVIYPQGTRVAPGDKLPYKVGAGLLYAQLGQPCHLAATNIGYFWPKRGILRKRGTAIVEFLTPLQPGLSVSTFMRTIEPQIEAASDRLLAEAKTKRAA
jgi:1-acyl-sn-glycerol-3-phosphate acyltransferase